MERICTNCGVIGSPKTDVRGSFFIELILWLCFIVPGLIYSIWRMSTKQKVCRSCGAPNLVALDSPRGQALRRELGSPR
jgi:hypothetical protein